MELSAIPLGLIPLAYASAIVRYRLMDIEVIVKRTLVYTAALSAIVAMYVVLLQLVERTFVRGANKHVGARAARNAGRRAARAAGEGLRPEHARSRVLSRSLRLPPRAGRVCARPEQRPRSSSARRASGVARRRNPAGRSHGADARGRSRHPTSGRFAARGSATSIRRRCPSDRASAPDCWRGMSSRSTIRWRSAALPSRRSSSGATPGLYYFVPCVAKEGTIAVLALGRKDTGEPLNSEDMALLSAVAGQIATALENARLYRQLHVKALGARSPARVQREHPRIARRRLWPGL